MDTLLAGAYRISEWVAKLAYVNIMWVLCIVAGLGIFGFFPATTAMFGVVRRWILGESDLPVFKTFWSYFKQDFKQANLLGLILVVLGAFLYFDLKFFQNNSHPAFGLISMFFIILLFLYFIVLLNIFPIFVHYDFKLLNYIKYSLILAIGRPLQTVMMILGFIAVYILLVSFPGLTIFFSGSLLSIVLMWISSLSFPKKELTN